MKNTLIFFIYVLIVSIIALAFFVVGLILGKIFVILTGEKSIYGIPIPVLVGIILVLNVKYKIDLTKFFKKDNNG